MIQHANTERLYIATYSDENVSNQIAIRLRHEGYDALTARDAGMLKRSDPEQFAFAIREQRTVLTHNRDDFAELHSQHLARGERHYGIVILIRRYPIGETITRLLELMDHTTALEIENQLRFV